MDRRSTCKSVVFLADRSKVHHQSAPSEDCDRDHNSRLLYPVQPLGRRRKGTSWNTPGLEETVGRQAPSQALAKPMACGASRSAPLRSRHERRICTAEAPSIDRPVLVQSTYSKFSSLLHSDPPSPSRPQAVNFAFIRSSSASCISIHHPRIGRRRRALVSPTKTYRSTVLTDTRASIPPV
jgi:hypothetical protein